MNKSQLVVLILLVIGLAVGYYFGAYVIPAGNDTSTISKKRECQEIGQRLHKQYKADVDDADSQESVLQAEYAYNRQLDTCLYSAGTIGANGFTNSWVKDSFSNKDIITFMQSDDDLVEFLCTERCTTDFDEFQRRKTELMGQ